MMDRKPGVEANKVSVAGMMAETVVHKASVADTMAESVVHKVFVADTMAGIVLGTEAVLATVLQVAAYCPLPGR